MSCLDQTSREILAEQAANEQADQREEAIDKLAQEKFAAMRQAIIGGDKAAAKEICDLLADYLSYGPDIALSLLCTALSGSADLTGREFVSILVSVIKANARHNADKEVDGGAE